MLCWNFNMLKCVRNEVICEKESNEGVVTKLGEESGIFLTSQRAHS